MRNAQLDNLAATAFKPNAERNMNLRQQNTTYERFVGFLKSWDIVIIAVDFL